MGLMEIRWEYEVRTHEIRDEVGGPFRIFLRGQPPTFTPGAPPFIEVVLDGYDGSPSTSVFVDKAPERTEVNPFPCRMGKRFKVTVEELP